MIRQMARKLLNYYFNRRGQLFRKNNDVIPEDIKEYLNNNNSKLLDLKSRYNDLNLFEHSVWKEFATQFDLQNFRSEGFYLSQLRFGSTRIKYLVTAAYVEAVDDWRLLDKLYEDSLFGAITFKFDKYIISMDLLDSILEITFLRRALGLQPEDNPVVMDIGAGYGRFAYRFTSVFPQSYVYCLDAVPESSFLCYFYINFRKFNAKAESLPLYEIDHLTDIPINLAVNIHSWSECTLKSVVYWIDMLADLKVTHLFVVPHHDNFLSKEADGTGKPIMPEITARGYDLKIRGNKFAGSRLLASYGIYNAPYFLFELKK